MDLVSRIADDIAHEIKNPLHSIVINLEVLRRRVENGAGPDALERAAVIDLELQRAHGLIDRLLKLLRPWPATSARVVAESMLDDIVPLAEIRVRARRGHFRFDADESARSAVLSRDADACRVAWLALAEWTLNFLPPDLGTLAASASRDGDVLRFEFEASAQPGPLQAVRIAERADEAPLGLARAAALGCGGSIHVAEDPLGQRATAILRVPVDPTA